MSDLRRYFSSPVVPGSRLGAMYSIPRSALGAEELEEEKQRLTMQAKCTFGAPPPPFPVFVEDDERLHVPRFYGLKRFGPAEVDDRVDGAPLAVAFEGTLTPVQQRAIDAFFHGPYAPGGEGGALLSLPCGGGKTVTSIHLAMRLGRRVAILVHKAVLREQWIGALRAFVPGIRVGVVQGDRFEVEDVDAVVCMVLTVARRQYDPSAFDSIGTVIVDEAHHLAAPLMSQAMRSFRARHICALSATKDRPDGLTPLLHYALGPMAFHAEREAELVRVTMAVFPDATPEVLTRDGKPVAAVMTNRIAAHPGRNAFLAERVAHYRAAGRCVMVLSDRITQLKTLRQLLLDRHGLPAEAVGFFDGSTKDQARALELAKPVVLCSYSMANEGLDKKELDTLVMATSKGRVTQCIGRIQRPCPTKQPPVVLDVVDPVSLFVHLRHKRRRYYESQRYQVQVVDATAVDDSWFC